jgi:MFS family permease
MTSARDITRTAPFWIVFAASALGGITNSASTPLIPVYVGEVLGGGTGLAGAIISLAAVASMISMPLAGVLGDRLGYRIIAVIGSVVATVAMVLLIAVPSLWGAGISRVLFGLGSSAAMTLLMAWLVTMAPPGQRGKALSIYGLSVWIGLALGPPLGTAVNAAADSRAVFLLCAALELITGVLVVLLPRATPPVVRPDAPPRPRGIRALWRAFLAVWTPGVVAAAAWCGEGLMLGFLIVHLSGSGIPATGITGAASVFAVFAVSVIVARLFLASLPDRIGPLRATAVSLVALTAGLATLAVAMNFWVAAVGAALIGIGFSPLYPSLTMLATRGLHPENRALGLGLFSSFTSIGYGGGAVIGGAVIASAPSMWAFLIVAGLQLLALAVLTIFTRDDSPRARPDAVEPRDPAA